MTTRDRTGRRLERRLDDVVLPGAARRLQTLAARRQALRRLARSRTGRAGGALHALDDRVLPNRRGRPLVLICLTSAVAGVLLVGYERTVSQPQSLSSAGPVVIPAAVVGPISGTDIASYVAGRRAELAARSRQPGAMSLALLDLVSPQSVTATVAALAAHPRLQPEHVYIAVGTGVFDVPVARLPADLVDTLTTASIRLLGDADLADREAALLPATDASVAATERQTAATDRQLASAVDPTRAAVVAVAAAGTLADLSGVSADPRVRLVDLAAPGTSAAGATFLPLLPSQTAGPVAPVRVQTQPTANLLSTAPPSVGMPSPAVSP